MSATVYIVDDDEQILKSLERLLVVKGYQVETFLSAGDFLKLPKFRYPSCALLDMKLPDLNGLELQKKLSSRDGNVPIIFITGHGDVPSSVKAMKEGALDFMLKPFDPDALLSIIGLALETSGRRQKENSEKNKVKILVDTLTDREQQVFVLVIKGLLNKQVAAQLGISEKTVKVHRGRVMDKLKVTSVAELVRLAGKI